MKTHDTVHTAGDSPRLPESGTLEAEMARPILGFIDAVNNDDFDAAIAHLAPDAVHHGRISNYRPEGVRVLFGMIRTVFPDLKFDVLDMRIEGNKVISRIAATGTHTGAYLGNEPTGRVVVWESTDIATVEVVATDEVATGSEIETQFETDAVPDGIRKVIERWWDLFNDPDLAGELGFPLGIMC